MNKTRATLKDLNSVSKEALIGFIRMQYFGVSKSDLLFEEWKVMSEKALKLMDESIAMRGNHHYNSPQYARAEQLWQAAERLGKKADALYAKIHPESGA